MFDIIFTLSYAPIPTLTKLSAKLFFFFLWDILLC